MANFGDWAVANLPIWLMTDVAAPTRPTAWYVKLHIGDPGTGGTLNAAGETTRQAADFGTTGLTNNADITWTNVSTAETYSHISIWDAATGGNCLWQGALSAPVTVAVGDTFTIATGDLDLSVA